MRRYKKYIDSGHDSIGVIPSHWEVKRIKYFLFPKKDKSKDGSEMLLSVSEHSGIIPRHFIREGEEHLSRSDSLEGYLIVKYGDLVNNIMLMWKRGLGVSKYEGIVSPAYSVFGFIDKAFPFYFDYLFRTDQYTLTFKRYSTGVIDSRLRLYDDEFGGLEAHFPPLPEQRSIAAYLDHKTAIIDDLIAKTEQKIELLKKYRAAIINHAVTKGLDPDVKMKDSGVEWIGETPEHWRVQPLKYVASIRNSSVDRHFLESDFPVKVLHYPAVYINEKITNEYNFDAGGCTEDEYSKFNLRRGDVLITKDSESANDIAVPCYIAEDLHNVVCGYHLTLITSDAEKLMGDYLFRFLQSSGPRSYFEIQAKGITRYGLSLYSIENFSVILPPLHEQKKIINYIDVRSQSIDRILHNDELRIKVLKEYRQSLISEVVTGKICVLDEVPNPT